MNARWIVLGALTLSGGALLVAACGGDDVASGSADASADSTTGDASRVPDATQDSTVDAPLDSPSATEGGPEASACAVFDASALDDAAVAAGFQEVWQTYRCWGCHQKTSQMVADGGVGIVLSGNNDGLGDSGRIFPPNLTNDPTGIGCWTNQQVADAILNGTRPDGGSLCPPMSKFGHALTVADGGPRPGTPMDAGTAQEIVAFLRSLPAVTNSVMQTTCPSPADGGPAGSDAAADAADGGSDGSGDTGSDASEAGDAGPG